MFQAVFKVACKSENLNTTSRQTGNDRYSLTYCFSAHACSSSNWTAHLVCPLMELPVALSTQTHLQNIACVRCYTDRILCWITVFSRQRFESRPHTPPMKRPIKILSTTILKNRTSSCHMWIELRMSSKSDNTLKTHWWLRHRCAGFVNPPSRKVKA